MMRAFFARRRRQKVPAPPKPSVLIESPREAYRQERPLRQIDNPLATVYRIYWAIVMDDAVTMRNEIEYFWGQHSWKVSDIPDPQDPEPERYAVVSAVPLILVAAFNNLINRGLPRDSPSIMTSEEMDKAMQRKKKLETVPKWAENAPPLGETLLLPSKDGALPKDFDDEISDDILAKKNVLCQKLHIYFV